MTAHRIVFAGTPDFALASLRALVDAGMPPVAVLTQPDRPSGRGRKLTASPVKRYALDLMLPVLQPATLRDAEAQADIALLKPDVMVVAAYGLLLPQAVLDLPRHGCVNVHASLLPRWRGAAPIQAAILAGDAESGVCLMKMEAGLDTGPVFAEARVAIGAATTAGELHDELALQGGKLLAGRLGEILEGCLAPCPQDDALATYAAKIDKRDARLDWSQPAVQLERAVRAYNPVPGANFGFCDERIKAWRARVGSACDGPPGELLSAGADGIEVACGEGSLVLTELQRPGRTRISAAEFDHQQDLAGQRFD